MKSLTKFLASSACAIALLASPVMAQKWTEEEIASGTKKQEFVRYAPSGKTMKIGHLYALEEDCSDAEFTYSIQKQAEHGKAEIVPASFHPTFGKENPRYKCNEQMIDGFLLTYTSKKDYTGPDSFTLLVVTSSGLAREETYTFNVRKFETPPAKKDRNASAVPAN